MTSFKDLKGRTWVVQFTLGALNRVRAELGLDLLTLHEADSPALLAMRDDPIALLSVMLVTLRPQLREAGVSDEDFGESLQEEHVQAAVEAFFQAMVDYYPPAQRAALQTVLETVLSAARKVREKATKRMQQTVRKLDLEQLESAIATQIEQSISGSITTGSPASPAASTRTG